jgi:hypothetical protein
MGGTLAITATVGSTAPRKLPVASPTKKPPLEQAPNREKAESASWSRRSTGRLSYRRALSQPDRQARPAPPSTDERANSQKSWATAKSTWLAR